MEEWREVPGFEGKYAVSDLGRVLSLRTNWRMLKPVIRSGYPSVTFSVNGLYQHRSIHRLVMDVFSPDNPENLREVDHKYGNKLDARLSSLERVSSSENKKRAYKIGLADRKGEKHHLSKLTNDQVLFIFNSNISCAELAKIFMVYSSEITAIKKGRRWTHVTGGKYVPQNRRKLTEDEVKSIYAEVGTCRGLAKKYGVAHSVIHSIKTGKSHQKTSIQKT